MSQILKVIFVAIALSITHLMLAGVMAWGYVDETSKSGVLYHYLYSLPYSLSLLLKLEGSIAVTSGFAVTSIWYISAVLVFRSVIQRVK